MYTIAVVEDTAEERAVAEEYLQRYSSQRRMALNCRSFESGERFLAEFHNDNDYDIVLLDIEMQGIDGLETARRLREQDDQLCLLFVTRMANYAVEGYSVRALDFLVKPVGYEIFCMKMDRAIRAVEHSRKKDIMVPTAEGYQRIRIADLYYVEVMNHTLHYHTGSGVLSVRGSIRDCEERLAPYDFARCNKSYLVNMNHVTEIRRSEIRVGDVLLPIGSTRRQSFLKQLTEFMGDVAL